MTRAPAARPASTVALLRRGADGGGEVLLTHRPASMAFGPGLHVFPGGAVDPGDRAGSVLASRSALDPAGCARGWAGDLPPDEALSHAVAAVRELYEEAGVLLARDRAGGDVDAGAVAAAAKAREPLESLVARLDLVLATDRLAPLTRWVTPPTPDATRRYDTRFFAADLPAGADVAIDAREVAAHEWLAPVEAIRRFRDGIIDLWPPTSVTLRQLGHAARTAELAGDVRPVGPMPEPVVDRDGAGGVVVRLGCAGGVPGVIGRCRLIGARRVVAVDPGDPTDAALDAILGAVAASGGALAGVVVTSSAAGRIAGAVGLALVADVPLLASPSAAPLVGDPCRIVQDGEVVDLGDVPLRVRVRAGWPDGELRLEAVDRAD